MVLLLPAERADSFVVVHWANTNNNNNSSIALGKF